MYIKSMRNKCTLIIDGNWLLNSRMFVMSDRFRKNQDEHTRAAAQAELSERLAKSIVFMLGKMSSIDNVILVADGGSWRKQLPKPILAQDIVYKGNRSLDEGLDWDCIFGALNKLCDRCNELGITTTRYLNIEGDDWVWYWTRRLNEDGINCIIWSVDNDLKQLVQVNNGAFTAWYCNDKTGLFLSKELETKEMSDIDFLMNPGTESPLLNSLKIAAGHVTYITPDSIVIGKVMCGDSGDNIKSVIRYQKDGRNRRLGEKEWKSISEAYNIKTIEDLEGDKETQIIKDLVSKYSDRSSKITAENIKAMIEYNKKLVWLHESIIPESLIQKMNEAEYKYCDMSYIRNNYKVLTGENTDDIESLFGGISL